MARKTVRIEIPRDPSEGITLLGKAKEQHEALGAASPLKELEWEKIILPAYARALAHDSKADEYHAKAETETGERNKDMPVVNESLRSIRDVLFGIYRANPKKLTEFGFNVSDSPAENGDKTEAPAAVAVGK
jgi:hypothetical protein